MKPKDIQDLIDFISKSGLDEVSIKTESFEISVKRSSSAVLVEAPKAVAPVASSPVTVAAPAETVAAPATTTPAAPAASEANLLTIKSPMIGTFYRSPNPESPSFVNVGDEVKAGQTVCIVEAMKLFNEIESEVSGRIVKVLVDNASPVEYDQPLFLVEPI
ncbi:acetyl-CoA carboxylase biotin carboxyl carrier protein [Eisenibacter elegans]|jgi:acetyl-CoA carboxylase biotin carboxyl carrier protein|uniref:acetyl-CoA carboxylase biotin carboxyl carrier protein n=1 Tax=Eisenibacter elegans TaxID=997 RepID=UPI0004154C3B|nr:acetyl-CoA carboxylase biotin carboxyl carrier protein [Eisenibacter elegans]